jgi:hypothetical protein
MKRRKNAIHSTTAAARPPESPPIFHCPLSARENRMLLAPSPVIGTIRIEAPGADGRSASRHDDSTLELLLGAFATGESLGDMPLGDEVPLRLIACTRLSRSSFHEHTAALVKANLTRLLVDLQAEYDRIGLPQPASHA